MPEQKFLPTTKTGTDKVVFVLSATVAGAFLAWGILGQSLGWQVAVGGALVLAAGALVVLYEEPEPIAPEAAGEVTIRP